MHMFLFLDGLGRWLDFSRFHRH